VTVEELLAEIDARGWFPYNIMCAPSGLWRAHLAAKGINKESVAACYTPFVQGDTLAEALAAAIKMIPKKAVPKDIFA